MADSDQYGAGQDDDYAYDNVTVEDDEDLDLEADVEDTEQFEALLRSVQTTKDRDAPPQVRADLTRLPEVVDDFVRNFFVKHGLLRTLDTFEIEWYERYGANPEEELQMVPDVYLENTRLVDRVAHLERELVKHRNISKKATTLWEQVKKERDLHRMNHNRVMQEKSKVSRDLQRMQNHAQSIDPIIAELRGKYETCQKEKMLLKLERDKLAARISTLEENVRELEGQPQEAAKSKEAATKSKVSTWPADSRPNPYISAPAKAPASGANLSCRTSFKAHAMAVTGVSLHHRKPIVATSSDDGTWRLFSLPQGELCMSGEGHKDWVSGVSINPRGTMACTASGDSTLKLWDFGTNACTATLKSHTEGVWCCTFQDTGDLIASGSMDHSARVWDVRTGKLKQTLRGHVDIVNSVNWIPYTNNLCSGSGDKTVSIWDTRANFCAQTLYGHTSAVSSVMPSVRGDIVASCDAVGNVIVWDVRMNEQRASYNCGPHPANCLAIDKSGTLIAVGCDDAIIRVINLLDDKISKLTGHEDAVQAVQWDPSTNAFLVSGGSDTTVRYWS